MQAHLRDCRLPAYEIVPTVVVFNQPNKKAKHFMEKPISLERLFKEKIFRIPDYQRGYAWQSPPLLQGIDSSGASRYRP